MSSCKLAWEKKVFYSISLNYQPSISSVCIDRKRQVILELTFYNSSFYTDKIKDEKRQKSLKWKTKTTLSQITVNLCTERQTKICGDREINQVIYNYIKKGSMN